MLVDDWPFVHWGEGFLAVDNFFPTFTLIRVLSLLAFYVSLIG
jgi:hypothetical protein